MPPPSLLGSAARRARKSPVGPLVVQARSKAPSFRTTVSGRPIVWEDPERGDLSSARAGALAARGRAAERALYGRGSWRRHLDERAAVDFALVSELFKNEDGFHASTFMALRDGRLHLGPVWDYDISMGNSDYGPSSRLEGWMLARRDWAERLYRDRRFAQRLAARWRQLRRAGLRRHVLAETTRAQRELRGSIVARGSHTAEVRHLRGWLKRRIGWIDRNVARL